MKLQLSKQEFNKMFTWFTNETTAPGLLKLDLDLYKKLWNFLLVGDSYYFVINHHTMQCDVVSKEVEHIMGYKSSEFDIFFMTGLIHHDDLPYFLAFGKKSMQFLSQLSIEK